MLQILKHYRTNPIANITNKTKNNGKMQSAHLLNDEKAQHVSHVIFNMSKNANKKISSHLNHYNKDIVVEYIRIKHKSNAYKVDFCTY